MFKRGGPSYQAQGTGITSPFDTPRRQYNTGTSWEEIQENIRKSTADNTTTMQDVAQGFSHLANPYKEDGSAKTVAEMIFEGSNAVSASRGERKKTAQAGELAAQEVGVEKLKSDLAIEEAQKERDLKIKIAAMKSDEYLQNLPRDRQIENMEKIWTDDKNNQAGGMTEFESAFSTRIPTALVDARMHNSKTRNDPDFVQAEVAPESAYTLTDAGWALDTSKLSNDRVWFDVTTGTWFFIDDAGNRIADYSISAVTNKFKANKKGMPVSSEGESVGDNAGTIKETEKGDVDSKGNLIKNKEEIKLKITTNLKDVDINDREFIFSEAEKVGITLVEPDGTKTWSMNLAENEMTLPAFKKLLQEKKMSDTYARLGKKKNNFEVKENIQVTEKMATGGVAGEDASISELDELNNWWRNQLATNWNE